MKTINLSGVVGWDITADKLRKQLANVPNSEEAILLVDSPGGSVFEGNRLYNLLRDYPGKIKVVLGAVAASAASYFPLGAGVENVYVRDNTTFMGHKAWAIILGNADFLKKEAEVLDGFDHMIAKVYSRASGGDKEKILEEMAAEFWLQGGEAVVAAGYAAGVVDIEKEEQETDDDTGAAEIVEKNEIQAMIKEAQSLLRQESIEEDLEKWSAQIRAELETVEIDQDEEGQKFLFPEKVTAPENKNRVENKKPEKEEKMDLNEYLEAHPEARAEIETDKATAANEATEKERERVNKILALAGCSVPDSVLASVKEGESIENFMESELSRRNEQIKNQKPEDKPDFGKASTDGQQDNNARLGDDGSTGKGSKEVKANNKFDSHLDSFYKKNGKEE